MPREDIAEEVSVCPFLLFQTSESIDTEETVANLTDLRKAIGAAITNINETGIVSDIMRWIGSNNFTLNGFVKTSKHLGASSLLTAIKNQCKNEDIPVAYIACGSPKEEKSASDKFYYRLKDLLLQDNLTEEAILAFFIKAFNLSNINDSLSEMCSILNVELEKLNTGDDVAKIIHFFKDNLNSIRKRYCDEYLSKSSKPEFLLEKSYRVRYDEAYKVFRAYCNHFGISVSCSESEEVVLDVQDGKVKRSTDRKSNNVVILIDDFEMAVKEIIGDNLETGKKIFNNTKDFLKIIKDINSNAKGVKFVVPIRSCIYNIGNFESEKKPLYLSTGWEALFQDESGKRLQNILINLLKICDDKCNCSRKCEYIWSGTVDDNIFNRGKIKQLVELCGNNPYYLFRSLFWIHKGVSDGLCASGADIKIKKYFKAQFKDDVFELLNLYLLNSIGDDVSLQGLELSSVVEVAMHWVEEFIAHKYECVSGKEYRICTIYAREKVSEQHENYSYLLGHKHIRKAIIDALQDVGVIMIRQNNNPDLRCPEFCFKSTSRLYAKYYKDGKYKQFEEFFIKNYPGNNSNINIKEYRLHPFINYIFSNDTIFETGEVA